MKKHMKKEHIIINKIKKHISINIKQYFIIAIVFLIGLVIGIVFINNIEEEQKIEIKNYLETFTNNINENYKINTLDLLKSSIINNAIFAFLLWFIGSTVIGIPIVYLIVGIRGFILGYTISSIAITFTFWKGIIFSICALLLQNIVLIPCIFALAVSGINLYKSIIKNRGRENIKVEILKHTLFSGTIAVILLGSSLIESYISSNLLMIFSKAFI